MLSLKIITGTSTDLCPLGILLRLNGRRLKSFVDYSKYIQSGRFPILGFQHLHSRMGNNFTLKTLSLVDKVIFQTKMNYLIVGMRNHYTAPMKSHHNHF